MYLARGWLSMWGGLGRECPWGRLAGSSTREGSNLEQKMATFRMEVAVQPIAFQLPSIIPVISPKCRACVGEQATGLFTRATV